MKQQLYRDDSGLFSLKKEWIESAMYLSFYIFLSSIAGMIVFSIVG